MLLGAGRRRPWPRSVRGKGQGQGQGRAPGWAGGSGFSSRGERDTWLVPLGPGLAPALALAPPRLPKIP